MLTQAYTNELEIKVARLMEENAKLRRQQEKVSTQNRIGKPEEGFFNFLM